MSLFEIITGIAPKDCVIDKRHERVIFLVDGSVPKRILNKKNKHLQQLEKTIKKTIEIVKYAETPELLIKNSLYPADVKNVKLTKKMENETVAIVTVDIKSRGAAIGKRGKNIDRARLLAKRHFNISNVILV